MECACDEDDASCRDLPVGTKRDEMEGWDARVECPCLSLCEELYAAESEQLLSKWLLISFSRILREQTGLGERVNDASTHASWHAPCHCREKQVGQVQLL